MIQMTAFSQTTLTQEKKKRLREALSVLLCVQVSDDDAVEGMVKVSGFRDEREVRVATMIIIAHVHSTIEHYPFSIDCDYHTAFPNFLPSTFLVQNKQASNYICKYIKHVL